MTDQSNQLAKFASLLNLHSIADIKQYNNKILQNQLYGASNGSLQLEFIKLNENQRLRVKDKLAQCVMKLGVLDVYEQINCGITDYRIFLGRLRKVENTKNKKESEDKAGVTLKSQQRESLFWRFFSTLTRSTPQPKQFTNTKTSENSHQEQSQHIKNGHDD